MIGEAILRALSVAGSVGFVLPLFVVSVGTLALSGAARLALCWTLSVAVSVAVTLGLKALLVDHPLLSSFPSGHVSLAVTFYGGFLLVLSAGSLSPRLRLALTLLLSALIGGCEGVSRVALTTHTWVDVVGGGGVGAAALLLGGTWTWPGVRGRARRRLLGACAIALVLALLVGPPLDQAIRLASRRI
jgi:membrane-associated phospholipid phosphatase